MQKYVLNNKIWDMPYLAPVAEKVNGIKSASKCLTNRASGEWKFLCKQISNIPIPTSDNQDFDFNAVDKEDWKDVIAPGSLTMQGFDIKNNIEYYYITKFAVDPKAIADKIGVYLQFEGVYSNCRVWVNNRYVTTHTGGFTPFVADISKYIGGGECELVIGVTDVEGKTAGIWNPKGQYISDAAWASYYAHTNVGGILRDITLYYLPKNYLISCKVNAKLDNLYENGVLKAEFLLDIANDVEVKTEICDADGKSVYCETYGVGKEYKMNEAEFGKKFKLNFDSYSYVNAAAKASDKKYSKLYCAFKAPTVKGELYGFSIEKNIGKVIGWNAEKPQLYTLRVEILSNSETTCVYSQKIGFRTIGYGGAGGGDKNKLYINGAEVKLRGVCRHDISYNYGRSLSKEDELREILSFKANNINHIRTSHYPASKHYLQLCDEYGIYAELENGVCFKGGNGYDMRCSAEQMLQNLSEMIEYGYNHPSVIILSTANESGFEKSSGFRLSYEYVKEKDLSRPTIFSYPHMVHSKPVPYDILSKHYAKVYGSLGDKNMPKLHDEFAHIACYNLKDLARDNNCRLAWSKSISIGWDNIMKTDGALGCALWGGIDDIFYLPEGITVAHQRHSAARAIGYGEWGAVLDVYKREKPEAYLTKKAFSPIKVTDFAVTADGVTFNLQNRFDHTNLNEVECVILGDTAEISKGNLQCDIPARKSGLIKIKIDTANVSKIDIAFNFGGFEAEREVFDIGKNTLESPFDKLAFTKKEMEIDRKAAVIMINNDCGEIATGPYLFVRNKRAKGIKRTVKESAQRDGKVTVIKEYFGALKTAKFIIKRLENGGVEIRLINNNAMAALLGNDYGVGFELCGGVKSVEWDKKTDYSYYPPEHLERAQGTAMLNIKNTEYGVLPDNAWKDDSYNYFLNNDEKNERLYVTNDFKTNRTNIKSYGVNSDRGGIWVHTNDKEVNCFTEYCKSVDYTDCASDRIRAQGSWKVINRSSEKQCVVSRKKGSSLSLEFSGTGVKIYGTRSKEQGIINIAVDGAQIRQTSTRSDICDVLDFMVLDTVTGLADGKHNLTVTLDDDKGVRISGFESIGAGAQQKKSHLYINRGKYFRSLAWGNYYGEKLSFTERKGFTFSIAATEKKD